MYTLRSTLIILRSSWSMQSLCYVPLILFYTFSCQIWVLLCQPKHQLQPQNVALDSSVLIIFLNPSLISLTLQLIINVWVSLIAASLQWEFHSCHGFSWCPCAYLPSTSVSLRCVPNALTNSNPCCSNWRIASYFTVIHQ
jgi:hypothetical protein